ncbi:MAG TPA: SRPBCC domain-containing protein [Bacteroidia bacterium]|nr:SRPBCC domain-containing protein [Bacteroidia bacterium]
MIKIYHNFKISASAEKVFDAVSTINGLKSWWTTETSGNPEPGGEIRFEFGKDLYDLMKVTAFEKNKSIEWEIIQSTFPECNLWLGTKISFNLLADGDKNTVVKFQHFNFGDTYEFCGVCNYQWAISMGSLKSLCETGKGKPQ